MHEHHECRPVHVSRQNSFLRLSAKLSDNPLKSFDTNKWLGLLAMSFICCNASLACILWKFTATGYTCKSEKKKNEERKKRKEMKKKTRNIQLKQVLYAASLPDVQE